MIFNRFEVFFHLNLKIIDCELTVCKISGTDEIPFQDEFVFVGKTDEELSLVCSTASVPKTCTTREDGWKGFRVEGTLDFSLIGILAKMADILANHKISVFVVSTFNTDYVLVKSEELEYAVKLLQERGYSFV
jgi:uncharacterized protein